MSRVKLKRYSCDSTSSICDQCTTRGPPSFSKLKCWFLAKTSLHSKEAAKEDGMSASAASMRADARGGYMVDRLRTFGCLEV